MGRCNNRRTQEAAKISGPSRARFSNWVPPSKKSGRGRGGRGRGGRGGRGGQGSSGAPPVKKGGEKTAFGNFASTIIKISERNDKRMLDARSGILSRSVGGAENDVDVSKLDQIAINEQSQGLIFKLLHALGVVDAGVDDALKARVISERQDDEHVPPPPLRAKEKLKKMEEVDGLGSYFLQPPTLDIDGGDFDAGADIIFENGPSSAARKKAAAYVEHDEDYEEVEEEEEEEDEEEEEGTVEAGSDEAEGGKEGGEGRSVPSASPINEPPPPPDSNPLFVHLSQKLSFNPDDASKAIMLSSSLALPSSSSKASDERAKTAADVDPAQLSAALDYLCLHLSEEELTKGFRYKPKKKAPPTLHMKSNVRHQRQARDLSSPGISLAPLPDFQLEARTFGFIRLGFGAFEAEKACKATTAKSGTPPERDDDALLILIDSLVDNLPDPPPVAADLAFATMERDDEREALIAILDKKMTVIAETRYQIDVDLIEELEPPGNSNACKLHVMLPDGYPTLTSARFLFTNGSMAPSLLRKINKLCNKVAKTQVGEPVVYTVVEELSSSVAVLQKKFLDAQKEKEVEAAKNREKKAREEGKAVERITQAQYDGEKLGKRARQKLKAAQKQRAQERENMSPALKKKLEREKRKEAERQNASASKVSSSELHIQRLMKKRAEERAEAAGRTAMTKALNDGLDGPAARKVCERVTKEVLKEEGWIEENDGEMKQNETQGTNSNCDTTAKEKGKEREKGKGEDKVHNNEEDSKDKEKGDRKKKGKAVEIEMKRNDEKGEEEAEKREGGKKSSTLTSSFITNLKTFYSVAQGRAKSNAATNPVANSASEEKKSPHHVPTPHFVPTQSLATVMRDIMESAKQPWLVAPEARAPVVADKVLPPKNEKKAPAAAPPLQMQASKEEPPSRPDPPALTEESIIEMKRLSSQLKFALESKHKNAGGNFLKMMECRRKLPAFEMGSEIVETIRDNQISVVSGDTGCGKTTQVPQLVLDDAIRSGRGAETNIIVTQPRRISASEFCPALNLNLLIFISFRSVRSPG